MVACYPATKYFWKTSRKSIIILRRASVDWEPALSVHANTVTWDSWFLLFYIFFFPFFCFWIWRPFSCQNADNALLSLWFLLTLKVCPLFCPYCFYASIIPKSLKCGIDLEATKFRTRLPISRVWWSQTLSTNTMSISKIGLRSGLKFCMFWKKILHIITLTSN